MPKEKITVDGYRCSRCDYKWVATKKRSIPRMCPKCKSLKWDEPVGIVILKPSVKVSLPDL